MDGINLSKFGKYFYKKYFDENICEEEKKELINYKNESIPPLFKYTNLNHIEDLLCEDLMFLSPISKLNDPNEGVINYNIYDVLYNILLSFHDIYNNFSSLNKNKHYDIFNKIILNMFFQINDLDLDSFNYKESNYYNYFYKMGIISHFSNLTNESIQGLTRDLKEYNYILAFSISNDNNPLWNHYADEHKGICIEYDIKNCGIDFIKNNCFPIFYDDSDFSDEITSLNDIKTKFLLKPLLKKESDWKYEQEWRIVLNQDLLLSEIDGYYCGYDNRNYIKFLKPKAVFMGKDILESDEEKIKEICQCRKIDLYKMEHKISQYKLTPKQINLDVENEGKNH